MYRILAIVWLVVGVGFILYDTFAETPILPLPFLGFSAGWVCLLLSLYNFVRWWGRRQSRLHREAEHRARVEDYYRRHPPRVRQEPPDPNFNFTDEPPQPEARE